MASAVLYVLFLSSVIATLTSASHEHHHSNPYLERALSVQTEDMIMDQAHDMKDHEDHKDMDMDMNMNDTHSMMYFHFGVEAYVLFKEWKTINAGGMLASVIGVFLMGMFYEGLKYFREYLFKQYVSNIQFSTVAITSESGKVQEVHKIQRHRILSWAHGLQTILHVVQIILSYFLMLIFMTYNVWLCMGVVLGSGFGYFVFGWRKASVVDITEHCH